jgi:hypothetical protein
VSQFSPSFSRNFVVSMDSYWKNFFALILKIKEMCFLLILPVFFCDLKLIFFSQIKYTFACERQHKISQKWTSDSPFSTSMKISTFFRCCQIQNKDPKICLCLKKISLLKKFFLKFQKNFVTSKIRKK